MSSGLSSSLANLGVTLSSILSGYGTIWQIAELATGAVLLTSAGA